MRAFRHGRRNLKRCVSAATISAVFLASAGQSFAAGADLGSSIHGRAVTPDGLAAMVRLHISFGDQANLSSRPLLGVALGSLWRSADQTEFAASSDFSPILEAGVSGAGAPVFRLGPMDLAERFGRRLNAAEQGGQGNSEGWSTSTWVLVGLGALATAGLVAGIIEEGKPHPDDGLNICDANFNCHY